MTDGPAILAIGNDLLVIVELFDDLTETYINDAVLTMTLRTLAGVAVSGGENVSLAYKAGSNGIYRGVLPGSMSLTANARYVLTVTAASPVGYRHDKAYVAQYRSD